jgi:hypothetical protein
VEKKIITEEITKSGHMGRLYKIITDMSEDLRDKKGYNEDEIKEFLTKQVNQIVNES